MNPTPASQQQFCVRWNSHLGSLGAAFPQLLAGQRFVDVTLACEGHQLHCHRLVLAACSSYFESLLSENPCKHPIIIMPHDIKLWEIQALVDFMYKGEVNVSQAGLPDLLKCAEVLQIRGLCGADAALNLNSIANSTTVLNTKDSNNCSIPCVDGIGQIATQSSSSGTVSTVSGSGIVGGGSGVLNSATTGSGTTTTTAAPATTTTTPPGLSSLPSNSSLTLTSPVLLSTASASSLSNSALKPPSGTRSNSALMSCPSPNSQQIGGSSSTYPGVGGLNHTKRLVTTLASFESSTPTTASKLDRLQQQQYSTSTPNSSIITPKLEPVDVSIVDDMDDDSINIVGDVTKAERDDGDYSEGSVKQPNEKQLHHPTKTQQHLIENLDDEIETAYRQENRNYKRNIYKYLKSGRSRPPMLDHDYDEENIFIDESDDSGSETLTENKIRAHQEDEDQDHQRQGSQQQHIEESSSDGPEPDCGGVGGLRKRPNPASEENQPSLKRPSVAPNVELSSEASTSSTLNRINIQNFGKIRVKPNENLYENYGKIESESNNNLSEQSRTDNEMIQQLPPSLKFNKDEMTIFVKNPEAIERNAITPGPGPLIRTVRSLVASHSAPPSLEVINRSDIVYGRTKCTETNHQITDGAPIMSSSSSSILSTTSSGSSPIGSLSGCDENSNRSMGLLCYTDTPEIGETTTVKTEVVISEEEMDSSSNCENIICSPSVHDYNNYNNDEADDEDDDDDDLIKMQNDTFKEEPSYGDIRLDDTHQVVIPHNLAGPSNIPTIIIPTLATYTPGHSHLSNSNGRILSTNSQCRVPPRGGNILKSAYLVTYNKTTGRYRELVGPITVGNMTGGMNTGIRYPSSSSSSASSIIQDKKTQVGDAHGPQGDHPKNDLLAAHHPSPSPSPSAVVLRNPRSNQPRSYSTEALYAALMDVKSGESIYRASQLHKVPRKTLRNWMKRWHIKSAFPMPRQLKQAAEKKRLKQMEHKMEKYN